MRGALPDFDQPRSNLAPNSLANLKAPSGADRGPLIVKAASQFGRSRGRAGEVISTSSISCHSGCCLSSRIIRAFNSAALFFSFMPFFSFIMSGLSRPNHRGRIRCSEHQNAQLQRQPGNRISRAPTKGPGESTGPQFLCTTKAKDYFCCSAGFSVGFGGLVWFCCGFAGVLGFWSPVAAPGELVIVISFHEYLKSIFQVHFEAGG
jgi:hypothetical protein